MEHFQFYNIECHETKYMSTFYIDFFIEKDHSNAFFNSCSSNWADTLYDNDIKGTKPIKNSLNQPICAQHKADFKFPGFKKLRWHSNLLVK